MFFTKKMMKRTQKILLILLLFTRLFLSEDTLSISRYWSGVVTEGREGKLGCRASAGISRCQWRKEDRGEVEYDSDMEYDMRDNVVVKIGRSPGVKMENMCFLTIMRTEILHAGLWSCHLYGDCLDRNGYNLSEKLTKKSENHCNKDRYDGMKCKGNATELVRLKTVDDDTIAVLAAQDLYSADIGSEVSLTARTNEEFDKCIVEKDNFDDFEITGDAEEEECRYMEGCLVCLSVLQSIPSCVLKIDRMMPSMKGVWTFTIKRRSEAERSRMLAASVDIKLVSNHGRNGIYLRHEDKDYRNEDEEIVVIAGNNTIQCVVEDDNSGQNIYFFVGNKNISKTGNICTGPENHFSHCLEFAMFVTPEHDKEVIKCMVDEEREYERKKIEISGILLVHFPPQIEGQENITIVMENKKERKGSDFDIKVEFASNPEPLEVEWLVISEDGEDMARILPGQRYDGYEAEEVTKIGNISSFYRYEAVLRIDKGMVDNEKKKLKLQVVNNIGTSIFTIDFQSMETASGTNSGKDDGKGGFNDTKDEKFETEDSKDKKKVMKAEDTNFMHKNKKNGNKMGMGNKGAFDMTNSKAGEDPGHLSPLMTSCLALGSSLLSQYDALGISSNGDINKEEFEMKVKNIMYNTNCPDKK